VERCLAKAERCQSMQEAALDLRQRLEQAERCQSMQEAALDLRQRLEQAERKP
jgi:hypothetical protein